MLPLVPGFIDVHVHGAGGQDVMCATPESLAVVATTLARGGTTSFLATTVTASPEMLCSSASGIADYIASQSNAAPSGNPMAELLGIHFEGPFISRARRGVHPEQWIAAASPELLRQLLDAARGRARILTLAPELPGCARTRGRGALRGHCGLAWPHGRNL